MAKIPFTKVEGLGNDFVVVDLRPGKPAAHAAQQVQDPKTVQAVCDRHFGIGADGILAILPGNEGDARMRVLNADGSEAEMCGNGLRCVAKVLYQDDPDLKKDLLRIDTGAGTLSCAIDAQNEEVRAVTVDMGKPRLSRKQLPMTGPENETVVRAPLGTSTRDFSVTAVSMGNPHAIIFVDDPAEDLMEMAKNFGPEIETHPLFPRRTNVEFARVVEREGRKEIDLVVWERGCGITLACGTGACATAVAAYLEGRGPGDIDVPVHLPGGTLIIRVNAGNTDPDRTASMSPGGVKMTGPARVVFRADLDLGTLSDKLSPV